MKNLELKASPKQDTQKPSLDSYARKLLKRDLETPTLLKRDLNTGVFL